MTEIQQALATEVHRNNLIALFTIIKNPRILPRTRVRVPQTTTVYLTI